MLKNLPQFFRSTRVTITAGTPARCQEIVVTALTYDWRLFQLLDGGKRVRGGWITGI